MPGNQTRSLLARSRLLKRVVKLTVCSSPRARDLTDPGWVLVILRGEASEKGRACRSWGRAAMLSSSAAYDKVGGRAPGHQPQQWFCPLMLWAAPTTQRKHGFLVCAPQISTGQKKWLLLFNACKSKGLYVNLKGYTGGLKQGSSRWVSILPAPTTGWGSDPLALKLKSESLSFCLSEVTVQSDNNGEKYIRFLGILLMRNIKLKKWYTLAFIEPTSTNKYTCSH